MLKHLQYARANGGNMQNLNDFDRDVQLLLDMIGGEPLAKSGFESEEPDADYRSDEEA
jgi:hypothetical protein